MVYRSVSGSATPTMYVEAKVERGNIISSITGTGQVSLLNQVDLKSKASGDVVGISVKPGQEVTVGTTLLSLDAQDARKTLRDAEANLEAAQLALAKLTEPADTLSNLQAQNALATAQQTKDNAINNLKKAYDDGFNSVATAFLDINPIVISLNDLLLYPWKSSKYLDDTSISSSAQDRKVMVVDELNKANPLIEKALSEYKTTNRSSATSSVESLISDTYDAVGALSQVVNSSKLLVDYVSTQTTTTGSVVAQIATDTANLKTWTGQMSTDLASLLSVKNTIEDSKNTILNSSGTVAEKAQSITKLDTGADPLDIQSAELTVTQRENAVRDAQDNLANYYPRAPFDGVVAKISVVKGDSVSSGTVVATFISKQQIAELSLNEVDAASVKVGQKATLTFDAAPDLTITGVVSEIDTLGTVSQGVVDYTVKIAMDTQDDQVKPGMSVSAAIITDARQDVLLVPNSAVKSQGNQSYIEMFDQPLPAPAVGAQGSVSAVAPRQQPVEIGLSNDTSTEIISGLKEGDRIVVKTIQSTTKTTTTTAPSLFGAVGGNRGGAAGGGALRGAGR